MRTRLLVPAGLRAAVFVLLLAVSPAAADDDTKRQPGPSTPRQTQHYYFEGGARVHHEYVLLAGHRGRFDPTLGRVDYVCGQRSLRNAGQSFAPTRGVIAFAIATMEDGTRPLTLVGQNAGLLRADESGALIFRVDPFTNCSVEISYGVPTGGP